MQEIQHIAIIMDGNRRFAKRLLMEPWKGHEYGAKKLEEVLKWCREFGIKIVTLYTLSIQNLFSRPKEELEFILNEFRKEFKKVLDKNNSIHKEKVKINIIGRINLLPSDLQDLFKSVMKITEKYSNYILNFAIAYGGQEEITDAVKRISKNVKNGKIEINEINEEIVKNALYTNGMPYPDIIIRTGGEKRLSNFLLWQCAYSELFFLDKMWPEITKEDFIQILNEYKLRERRFGK